MIIPKTIKDIPSILTPVGRNTLFADSTSGAFVCDSTFSTGSIGLPFGQPHCEQNLLVAICAVPQLAQLSKSSNEPFWDFPYNNVSM